MSLLEKVTLKLEFAGRLGVWQGRGSMLQERDYSLRQRPEAQRGSTAIKRGSLGMLNREGPRICCQKKVKFLQAAARGAPGAGVKLQKG